MPICLREVLTEYDMSRASSCHTRLCPAMRSERHPAWHLAEASRPAAPPTMILHPRRCDSGRLLTYVHLLTTADQLCREYSSVSSGLSYTMDCCLGGCSHVASRPSQQCVCRFVLEAPASARSKEDSGGTRQEKRPRHASLIHYQQKNCTEVMI
eukprot:s6581_g1.t1